MLRMKFSIMELVFLFGTVCAFSFQDNVAAESRALDNEKEVEIHETSRTIPLGDPCDTNQNECQCYGKQTFCGCGFLSLGSCVCRVGTRFVISMKNFCPNKAEWANEGLITQNRKSIPVGTECDLNKDICQCYGKRGYCDCGAKSCTCKEASEDDHFIKSIEELKSNCENKEEWESE